MGCFICPALWLSVGSHGERTQMTQQQVAMRYFGDFRRHMRVNIAQTALDALRVIDWPSPTWVSNRLSAWAGPIHGREHRYHRCWNRPRTRRVAAVASPPDWLRPGTMDLTRPEHPPLPTGAPDAYARKFYELFNPITHLANYAHAPEIHFVNGKKDDHVPPEASFRFKAALAELYPQAAENITIDLLPGQDHGSIWTVSDQWWPELVAWLARPLGQQN